MSQKGKKKINTGKTLRGRIKPHLHCLKTRKTGRGDARGKLQLRKVVSQKNLKRETRDRGGRCASPQGKRSGGGK